MSQNVLVTTSVVGAVRVRAGWDSPLKGLFCNIESLEGNLSVDDSAPACFYKTAYKDVDAIIESLRGAEIRLVQSMIDAIQRDWRDSAKNVIRVFGEDGSVLS